MMRKWLSVTRMDLRILGPNLFLPLAVCALYGLVLLSLQRAGNDVWLAVAPLAELLFPLAAA